MSELGISIARLLVRTAIGVLIIVEVVLGLGVLVQALGANPDADFAKWALENQDKLMGPFEHLFSDVTIGSTDSVVDLSGVFALVFYCFLFIPLGMAGRRVERASRRGEAIRRQEAEAERQERMFGTKPVPVYVDRRSDDDRVSVSDRIVAVLGRRRGERAPVAAESGDQATPANVVEAAKPTNDG